MPVLPPVAAGSRGITARRASSPRLESLRMPSPRQRSPRQRSPKQPSPRMPSPRQRSPRTSITSLGGAAASPKGPGRKVLLPGIKVVEVQRGAQTAPCGPAPHSQEERSTIDSVRSRRSRLASSAQSCCSPVPVAVKVGAWSMRDDSPTSSPSPSHWNVHDRIESPQSPIHFGDSNCPSPAMMTAKSAPTYSAQEAKAVKPIDGGVSNLLARRLHAVSQRVSGCESIFSNGSAASSSCTIYPAQPLVHMSGQLSLTVPTSRRKIELLPEGEKIFDRYCWDRVLQEDGDGGKVVVCQRKADVESLGSSSAPRLVLKMRAKDTLGQEAVRYKAVQLALLNMAPHPGVVVYNELLEDSKFFYMLMEYGAGGSLIQGLLDTYRDGIIPDSALSGLMRDILVAIGHVHQAGLLHRDIKPDNLVMRGPRDGEGDIGRRVMLIDFDFAQAAGRGLPVLSVESGSFCGTPRFSAPECFLGRHSRASDLYSVGATLYLLVAGKMPYPDEVFDCAYADESGDLSMAMRSIYARLRATPLDWSSAAWDAQPDCRDFCQDLMAFEPTSRFCSAEAALLHRWLSSSR